MKTNTALAVILFYVAIVIGFGYGWVMNIISIIHANSISGMVIARVIGVFVAPLGGVLGYF